MMFAFLTDVFPARKRRSFNQRKLHFSIV